MIFLIIYLYAVFKVHENEKFGFRQGKMTKTILSVCRGNLDAVLIKIWGCSSAGSAPALQAGGQEFDPPHLHHANLFISN